MQEQQEQQQQEQQQRLWIPTRWGIRQRLAAEGEVKKDKKKNNKQSNTPWSNTKSGISEMSTMFLKQMQPMGLTWRLRSAIIHMHSLNWEEALENPYFF